MEIEYYRKNVYGQELLYVKNPNQAHLISKLTGQKTINSIQMNTLCQLTMNYITWKEVLP